MTSIGNPAWGPPPPQPELEDGAIHIWRSWLESSGGRLGRLAQLLSPEETDRASRLRREQDQEKFILARGALRVILSKYAGAPPETIAFANNTFGKPFLIHPAVRPVLSFNLSHSGDLVLCAVTVSRQVGVDLEQLRPIQNMQTIAQRYFAADEISFFGKFPFQEQPRAFFQIWTRKEAYIKARGHGLSIRLESFSVVDCPKEIEEPPQGLDVETSPDVWSLSELPVDDDYVAALAVEGRGCSVKQWELSSTDLGFTHTVSP